MYVIQITPTLPPNINGIGDYSATLAKAMLIGEGLASSFVLTKQDPTTVSPAGPVCYLADHTADGLCEAIHSASQRKQPHCLLVHFCGYSYQKRGCPIWFIQGVNRLRKLSPATTVVTMFHELYAFGLPWQSSFWLSPLQRLIARNLLASSDAAATNCSNAAEHLRAWDRSKPIEVLPVFSNVGEPLASTPYSLREPALVVFGQRNSRERAHIFLSSEPTLLARLQINEIWDIGPGETTEPRLAGVCFKKFGELPADEISDLLGKGKAGLLAYRKSRLSRSGVFAAYAAHGLLPLVAPISGLREPETVQRDICWYAGGRTSKLPAPECQKRIASAAHSWYQGHSAAVHARRIARLLESSGLSGKRFGVS